MAEKRFLADAASMDNIVQLQRKTESGVKRDKKRASKMDWREEEAQAFWGMLDADDDAGIVSQSSGGLQRMMTVIVTACAAFELTVSEAKD